MRIVQLTSTSSGGVARHARQVAGLLAGAGEQVLLAGPREVVADSPVPTAVVDIADRPRPGDLAAISRLRRLLRTADLVHAHGLRAGAAAVLATRALKARPAVVVTLHNLPVGGARVQAVARVLEVIVARGADLVLGVSGDLVARAARLGAQTTRALVPAPERDTAAAPEREMAVAPDADAAARLRADLGLAAGEALVLTVGRLAPQKGLDLLCDTAAAMLRAEPPAFRWVVVGDGPLAEDLRDRVLAEALPIVVAGRRDDVPELNRAASVVVSTSTWEGQPLAVQEALQAGAAVVATDVGGTREVTGEAAVLTPPDAGALAAAVIGLLADPAHRERLREAARERAGQLPTPADVLDQLRSAYAGLRARR